MNTLSLAGKPSRKATRTWAVSLAVPATYLMLTALWLGRTWLAPQARVVGIGGDPLDAIWYLTWIPYAITHLTNPLFTNLMSYPQGANLMWDTSAPLLGLIAWPVTALMGPVFAYNALLTLGMAASAWCVYLLLERWVIHRSVAFFGGLCFLISPYMAGQALEHVFFVAVPLVPLAVLWADWAVVNNQGSPRQAGVIVGTIVTAEFFISEEVAASMLLMFVLGMAWLALLNRDAARARLGRILATGEWAALVVVPLVAVPLGWQYLGPGVIHGAIINPTDLSGRLLAYVVPGLLQLMSAAPGYSLIAGAGYNVVDFGNYVGIPLLILLAIGVVVGWRSRRVRVLVGMLCTTAVLILGPWLHIGGRVTEVPLPSIFLRFVPGLVDLLPVRLSLYLDLFAVLLLALTIDRLLDTRWRMWAVLAAGVVVISWLPYVPFPTSSHSIPRFFYKGLLPPGQVLFVVPFATSVNEDAAMEWQATAGMSFKMVDGYYTRTAGSSGPFYHGPPLNLLTWDLWTLEHGGYGPGPVVYREFGFTPIVHWLGRRYTATVHAEPFVTGALLQFTLGYLSQHHVDSVVLGPCPRHKALDQFLVKLLGHSSQTQGVSVWSRPPGGWTTLTR